MLDLWKSWSTPVEPFPWRTVKIVNSYSEMANKNPLDDSRHAKTSEVTVSKFYRLPESQSGPQKFKKSLEVPICWLLIWSREPPRDWRFQVSTAVRKIYMSPWSLFVWSCLIFAHSLGYHWEGNGFCPLRSPIEYLSNMGAVRVIASGAVWTASSGPKIFSRRSGSDFPNEAMRNQ